MADGNGLQLAREQRACVIPKRQVGRNGETANQQPKLTQVNEPSAQGTYKIATTAIGRASCRSIEVYKRKGARKNPSGGVATALGLGGDVVVQGGRAAVEPGDDVVRRQPAAVALPEAPHADVGDLPEHVVVLDEGLLHELRERHPLLANRNRVQGSQTSHMGCEDAAREVDTARDGTSCVVYLGCLDLRLVDADVVGQWPQHADEEQVRLLERHIMCMPATFLERQLSDSLL